MTAVAVARPMLPISRHRGSAHVPQRRSSSVPSVSRRRTSAGGKARALQHLLGLPPNDAQLLRLAAAAVLVAQSGGRCTGASASFGRAADFAGGTCWWTEEMTCQLAEVDHLESAWRSIFEGGMGPGDDAVMRGAALYLAFREMEAAVRGGAPLPCREQVLVKVARALLGRSFDALWEVEAAVAHILEGTSPDGAEECMT
mmetsp:Transcript_132017/g.422866  ORF Transcript_132017/g.422866 Transcript_132017/m.422866 type:complete len:200 (+) Transcript_132017:159-758(+)